MDAGNGGKQRLALQPLNALNRPMQQLEEKIAHLTRSVDELSDIVARQEAEINKLTRRVRMLMEREAGREAASGGHVVLGDERPPHY